MPACIRSGYGVLTEKNELVKFDPAGNKKVQAVIAKSDKREDWLVRVSGVRSGDQMSVAKIELIDR
jgi:hypothetical protein